MLVPESSSENILGLGHTGLPGNPMPPGHFEMYGLGDTGNLDMMGVIEWLKNPGNLILVGAGLALILYVANKD